MIDILSVNRNQVASQAHKELNKYSTQRVFFYHIRHTDRIPVHSITDSFFLNCFSESKVHLAEGKQTAATFQGGQIHEQPGKF